MPGKVAIYTIFRCTNYGAVLQAYALARVLRGFRGEDAVDVINHRMDPRDSHLLGKVTNPNTPWFQRWRNRRKFAARYFRPDLFEARRQKTVRLIESEIRPTAHLYVNPRELKMLPAYETVVVGSDQVWNPGINHDFGHNQYLAVDFPESQDRVAYAASFGVSEIPAEMIAGYGAALGRFRRITVREETGADICERLAGRRPEVVLDPTMLLSDDEWREAAGGMPEAADGGSAGRSCRHLAAYWVRTVTQDDVEALARIARERGGCVDLMSAGPLPKLAFPPEVFPSVDVDPFGFVRAIDAAEALVTDSFHGLQFATLFGRPFIALGSISDARSNASRLVDFCARYGLSAGVADIAAFRSGRTCPFADMGTFREKALAADRVRSMEALKGLMP